MQYIMTWDKCGGSRFTHYTTHVALNYKNIFFVERENHTHWYFLEPIPLSAIWTIASMRLSSHALRCETRCWGTSDESGQLCTLCSNKFESLSITLWYNALSLIIFDHAFHTSSTKPNLCTNFAYNHNVHSWLQHSLVKFLNIESNIWNVIFLIS